MCWQNEWYHLKHSKFHYEMQNILVVCGHSFMVKTFKNIERAVTPAENKSLYRYGNTKSTIGRSSSRAIQRYMTQLYIAQRRYVIIPIERSWTQFFNGQAHPAVRKCVDITAYLPPTSQERFISNGLYWRHYFFIPPILKGRYTSHTHVCHSYLRHTCVCRRYLWHAQYAPVEWVCLSRLRHFILNHYLNDWGILSMPQISAAYMSVTRVSPFENGRNEKIMSYWCYWINKKSDLSSSCRRWFFNFCPLRSMKKLYVTSRIMSLTYLNGILYSSIESR